MGREFETKVLDINIDQIDSKLRELNAEGGDEVLIRQLAYNISNEPIEEFVTLRDLGDKCTVTHKRKESYGVGGTEEIVSECKDFDIMAEFLSRLNFYKFKLYQERKRRKFVYEDIEFCIDIWPKVKPFLEIEGKSEEDVQKGLKLLNLLGKDVGDISHLEIYSREGLDLQSIEVLKF